MRSTFDIEFQWNGIYILLIEISHWRWLCITRIECLWQVCYQQSFESRCLQYDLLKLRVISYFSICADSLNSANIWHWNACVLEFIILKHIIKIWYVIKIWHVIKIWRVIMIRHFIKIWCSSWYDTVLWWDILSIYCILVSSYR